MSLGEPGGAPEIGATIPPATPVENLRKHGNAVAVVGAEQSLILALDGNKPKVRVWDASDGRQRRGITVGPGMTLEQLVGDRVRDPAFLALPPITGESVRRRFGWSLVFGLPFWLITIPVLLYFVDGVETLAIFAILIGYWAYRSFRDLKPRERSRFQLPTGQTLPLPEGFEMALARSRALPGPIASDERVRAIRDEYAALQLDIVTRIEQPALFDQSEPATSAFLAALIAHDDAPNATIRDELAADVELKYSVARAHAETVGLHHFPESARDDAQLAAKAARLAQGATTPGEREASLTQVKRILDSLAIHYLPQLDEHLAIEPPSASTQS